MGEKSVNLNSFVLSGFGQESIILGVHLSNTCSRIREWKTWFITRLLLYDAVFEYFSTGRQLIRLYSKNYRNLNIVFHFDETFSNPKNSRFFHTSRFKSTTKLFWRASNRLVTSFTPARPSKWTSSHSGEFRETFPTDFPPVHQSYRINTSDGHAIIQFIPGCFYNICQHDCTMETNNVR